MGTTMHDALTYVWVITAVRDYVSPHSEIVSSGRADCIVTDIQLGPGGSISSIYLEYFDSK